MPSKERQLPKSVRKADPFGQRLKELRKSRNLTQEDAAAQIGTSRSHLAAIETGDGKPSRELLIAIAGFYKTSLDDLVQLADRDVSPLSSDPVKRARQVAFLRFLDSLSPQKLEAFLILNNLSPDPPARES